MLRDDTHAARQELEQDKEYQANKKRAEELKKQKEKEEENLKY